jgi:hypothetical protein
VPPPWLESRTALDPESPLPDTLPLSELAAVSPEPLELEGVPVVSPELELVATTLCGTGLEPSPPEPGAESLLPPPAGWPGPSRVEAPLGETAGAEGGAGALPAGSPAPEDAASLDAGLTGVAAGVLTARAGLWCGDSTRTDGAARTASLDFGVDLTDAITRDAGAGAVSGAEAVTDFAARSEAEEMTRRTEWLSTAATVPPATTIVAAPAASLATSGAERTFATAPVVEGSGMPPIALVSASRIAASGATPPIDP